MSARSWYRQSGVKGLDRYVTVLSAQAAVARADLYRLGAQVRINEATWLQRTIFPPIIEVTGSGHRNTRPERRDKPQTRPPMHQKSEVEKEIA